MIGLIFLLIVLSLALVGVILFIRQRNIIWQTLRSWVIDLAQTRGRLQRRNFRQLWRELLTFRRSNYRSKPKREQTRLLNSDLLLHLLLPIFALILLFLVMATTLPGSVLAYPLDRSTPGIAKVDFEDTLIPGLVANAITGTIFRDFNSNGTRDALEPGVPNIVVTAYLPDGTVIPPATTDINGYYTIPGIPTGAKVRVEVTGLPTYLQPGPAGPDSQTTVTFANENDTNVDVGLVNPSQYCQTNPDMATACYINGDPLKGGDAAGQDVLVTFPHDTSSGTTPAPTHRASGAEIGTTWGLAYQRQTGMLFAAALLRRHAGFGPNVAGSGSPRTGVIYQIDKNNNITPFINLNDIGGNTGAEPASRANPPPIGLPADMNTPNHDPDAWDAAGKIAIGDIDISADEQSLWVVSLNDQALYKVDIGLPPTPPTGLTKVPITVGGGTACPQTDIRPWAVQVQDGMVYVGLVCSAESTPTNFGNLRAYVVSLDPANLGGGFSLVFEFPLGNFSRGSITQNPFVAPPELFLADWRPWVPQMSTVYTNTSGNPTQGTLAFGKGSIYPQPILSDIEIDENGSFILGFIDRNGLQTGNSNYTTTVGAPNLVPLVTGIITPPGPPPGSPLPLWEGVMGGDLIRVCKLPPPGGGYQVENNGTCGGTTTAGAGNNEGPGGGEFYFEDRFKLAGGQEIHQQTTMGGLAFVPGSGQVATIMFDPLTDAVRSAGVGWFNNSGPNAGRRGRNYQIFGTDALTDPTQTIPGTFGKAVGLGDLQLLCNSAPIEIGNYVWIDADSDGIQDADETPVAGVVVNLLQNGVVVATTMTDAQGQYLFNDANVPGNLQFNTDYQIQIAPTNFNPGQPLEGFTPTTPDADAGPNGDIHDSDGVDVGGGVIGVNLTTGNPGANNHTYDFGFVTVADIAVMISATPAVPGQPITYTIAVTLAGNILAPLTNISLTTNLPAAIQNPIYIPGVGTYNPNTGVWSGLNMTPGDQIILTVVGTVPPDFSGTLQTTVTIDGDGFVDSVNANNVAQNTQVVQPPATGGGGDDDSSNSTSSSAGDSAAAPAPAPAPTAVPTQQPALPVLLLPETGIKPALEVYNRGMLLFGLLGLGAAVFYWWRRRSSKKD